MKTTIIICLISLGLISCTKDFKDSKIELSKSIRKSSFFTGSTNFDLLFEKKAILENQGDYLGYKFMVGDMTGNGRSDLVAVAPQYGRVVVWPNNGASFTIPSGNPAWMENQGDYTSYEFMIGDMTGDGKADLVAVAPQHGRVVVWPSNGGGFDIPSGNPAWLEHQGDYTGYEFMVGDMTGDGSFDLIAVAPKHGRAVVWESNNSGFIIPSGNPAWMENQGDYTGYKFMVGDVTGDGSFDLIAVAPKHGRAVVWESNNSGFIIPSGNPAWMENQGDYTGYKFMVGDMTGDKKADLVAVTPQYGRTVVWPSNGASFNIPTGNPAWIENQGDYSNYTFCLGEINGRVFSGDIKWDLIAINNSNAQTIIWSLNHYVSKSRSSTLIPSELRRIGGNYWNNDDVQMPYLIHIPEENRLIMELLTFTDIIDNKLVNDRTVMIDSYDNGLSWSDRINFPDKKQFLGLTNAGNGILYTFNGIPFFFGMDSKYQLYKSTDNGVNWTPAGNNSTHLPGDTIPAYTWDPLLVDDNSGNQKLAQVGYVPNNGKLGETGYYSQPYIRFSTDEARTWSTPTKITEWKGVNEVNLIVANNGDWIAACRLDSDMSHHQGHEGNFDNYSGLAISISSDQGKSWSPLSKLFDYGRHHPCMILLDDNQTILMTYAVRVGGCLGASDDFNNSPDNYPYYGIEAIVSHDNGRNWDIDNRYILSKWKGNKSINEPNYYFRSSQSTSTVQLPDGTLLTAYGTGRYRTGNSGKSDWFMDIDLLKWKMSDNGLH